MLNSNSRCSLCCKRSTASPKQVLHRKRASASTFKFQYLLLSLRLSSSCLSLHVFPPLYFSISNMFYKVVPMQMRPIQLAFLHFTVCWMFLSSLTPCNIFFIFHIISPTDLLHPSPAPRLNPLKTCHNTNIIPNKCQITTYSGLSNYLYWLKFLQVIFCFFSYIWATSSGAPTYPYMFSGVHVILGMLNDQDTVDKESSQLKKLLG